MRFSKCVFHEIGLIIARKLSTLFRTGAAGCSIDAALLVVPARYIVLDKERTSTRFTVGARRSRFVASTFEDARAI